MAWEVLPCEQELVRARPKPLIDGSLVVALALLALLAGAGVVGVVLAVAEERTRAPCSWI